MSVAARPPISALQDGSKPGQVPMQGLINHPFLIGAFLSLAVAVPIGPVALAYIRRTFACGLGPGVAGGLDVATVHLLFGAIGLSALGAAGDLLPLNHAGVEIAGSTIVIVIAVRSFARAHPAGDAAGPGGAGGMISAYAATSLLALSNPLTIINLAAGFSTSGLFGADCVWPVTAGMFCGSALWWTVLCGVVAAFRQRLSPGTMLWMSRAASVLMASLGLLSITRAI